MYVIPPLDGRVTWIYRAAADTLRRLVSFQIAPLLMPCDRVYSGGNLGFPGGDNLREVAR